MTVCIVGHGKSLEGKGLGARIDQCDAVFRLKKGWKLCQENPVDYGVKTTHLVSSSETTGTYPTSADLVLSNLKNASLYSYPKYGWYSDIMLNEAERVIGKKICIPLNLLNHWNWQFRRMGAKHPNFSLGMSAVVIAAHSLEPDTIVLAGMDSIMNPTCEFTRITSIPRTGAGDFPNHDWVAEHALLDFLSNHYEFDYRSL